MATPAGAVGSDEFNRQLIGKLKEQIALLEARVLDPAYFFGTISANIDAVITAILDTYVAANPLQTMTAARDALLVAILDTPIQGTRAILDPEGTLISGLFEVLDINEVFPEVYDEGTADRPGAIFSLPSTI